MSRDPPVTGPNVGDSKSQFSNAKRKEEEVPSLNGTVCPPKTCTSSRVAERMELAHFGERHIIVVLDTGTTGAENTEDTKVAENLHRKATSNVKPAPETVIAEPPATGAVLGDTEIQDA